MSRPIKRRRVENYNRDVEALGRLRTAIMQDTSLDATAINDAITDIDRLMKSLITLSNSIKIQKSA